MILDSSWLYKYIWKGVTKEAKRIEKNTVGITTYKGLLRKKEKKGKTKGECLYVKENQ